MTRAGALVSSLAWSVAYGVAVAVGLWVKLPGDALAIIWPACGVAALWLLGRRGLVRVLDLTLLAAVTVLMNAWTGVPLGMSSWFVVVNVAQALIGALLLQRLCPELWRCGGTATFDSVGRVFRLLAVAVISSFAAALVAAVGLAWFLQAPNAIDVAVHWGRNTYGFLAVVALVHLVAHAWRFRGAGRPVLRSGSLPELTLLFATTLILFGVAFLQSSLPLAYIPAAVTIWAGLRFSPVIVAVHGTLAGAFALAAAMVGFGPFAVVADAPARGLLVQLLITILLVKGLSLAAVRAHQHRLLDEVEAGSRAATGQAALLSTIMDTIQPGLVVLDPAGRPTRVNEAAGALLEKHPAVSLDGPGSAPGTSTATGDDPWAAVWAHVAGLASSSPFDLRLDGDVSTTVLELRPTPMVHGQERAGTVVLLTDVTAERAVREALTGFAGTVAHDLRGPLSGVKGWSHALSDELESGDADLALASTMVRRVITAANRMDGLIGDLLAHAVSRDGALHPTTVLLDRVALEVAESLGREGQLVVHDIVEVHADEALVRHLVTNVVGNAVKYVAPGTTPAVTLSARPDHDMVEVRLCDNGVGIPAEERERVFEQFHRVHDDYPGTGLGLAICRTIVERHGGHIRAEAGEHGGTCIVFTLPAPPRSTGPDGPSLRDQPVRAAPAASVVRVAAGRPGDEPYRPVVV